MNIFTRFLAQGSSDQHLQLFIERWDTLETLLVGVYRSGEATPGDEALYVPTRQALLSTYDRWRADLLPFWQKSKVGGKLDHDDPFVFILKYEQAGDFIDNWPALQHLPAAREALNGLVVALTGES